MTDTEQPTPEGTASMYTTFWIRGVPAVGLGPSAGWDSNTVALIVDNEYMMFDTFDNLEAWTRNVLDLITERRAVTAAAPVAHPDGRGPSAGSKNGATCEGATPSAATDGGVRHTPKDLDAFASVGIDPTSTQPNEHTKQCAMCREPNLNLAAYCDDHYVAPAAVRHARSLESIEAHACGGWSE